MTATSTSTEPDQGASPGRDLLAAIVMGVALAVAFIWAVLTSQMAVAIVVGVFVALGVVEASAQFRRHGIAPVVLVLLATTAVTFGVTLHLDHYGQVLGMVVLLLGSGLWLLVDRTHTNALARMGATVLLGLWLPLLGSFAILLTGLDGGGLAILLVIVSAAMSDVGAYAVGSLVGRHKIAPRLSPNKSWEGLAGGLVAAAAGAWALVAWIAPPVFDQVLLTPGIGVAIGVACAVAAFGGDLFESMIKRDLGIKDFGSLLPGHGGILDRFDGILVALPVGWLLLVMA